MQQSLKSYLILPVLAAQLPRRPSSVLISHMPTCPSSQFTYTTHQLATTYTHRKSKFNSDSRGCQGFPSALAPANGIRWYEQVVISVIVIGHVVLCFSVLQAVLCCGCAKILDLPNANLCKVCQFFLQAGMQSEDSAMLCLACILHQEHHHKAFRQILLPGYVQYLPPDSQSPQPVGPRDRFFKEPWSVGGASMSGTSSVSVH